MGQLYGRGAIREKKEKKEKKKKKVTVPVYNTTAWAPPLILSDHTSQFRLTYDVITHTNFENNRLKNVAGLRVEIWCFSITSTDALNMVGPAGQPVILKISVTLPFNM